MNEVSFDKSRYHQHPAMEHWCRQYIGPGGWTYNTPKTWEGMGNKIWVMQSMFGNVTFAFKNKKDLEFFLLKWT